MHCYKHTNNVFIRVTGEKNADHAITLIEINKANFSKFLEAFHFASLT